MPSPSLVPSIVPSVELLRWPAEAARRHDLAHRGVPRLLLIDPGAPPPVSWDPGEDWVRLPADPDDLVARCAQLADAPAGAGAPVVLLADGAAHGPLGAVDLDPVAASVLAVLLARWGRPVARQALAPSPAELDAELDPVLDAVLEGLRASLEVVGMELLDLDDGRVLLAVR
jgi:hypothetical protein